MDSLEEVAFWLGALRFLELQVLKHVFVMHFKRHFKKTLDKSFVFEFDL